MQQPQVPSHPHASCAELSFPGIELQHCIESYPLSCEKNYGFLT